MMRLGLRTEMAIALGAVVLLTILASPVVLLAQVDTGTIYGVVADSSGAVIPGAKVTVTNEATGLSRTVTTESEGHYDIPLVRVGTYMVTVEKVGFKTHTRHGVIVAVTESTRLDITLDVGEVTQTVEVEASAMATVETRDTTLGGVIDQRRIIEMPLNGRNFIQLSYFVPGVTVNYRQISLRGSPLSVPGSVQLLPYVNGMRNTMNAVLIDGAPNNDPVLNTAAIVPVPDAIQEFKIQTNLYSPEYGQGGGSVISIVTKSGGKDFHGSLYYFGRNDVFDARNFVLAQKPLLRRHQFGVAGGGPVKIGGLGKKTFFFTTYEGLRLDQGLVLNSLVPSLAQRRGDFTGLPPLRDPIGGCITNNIINPACMDPVAVRLIPRLWPEPNAGINNFQASPVLTNDRNQFLIKLDHSTASHTLSGRYVIDSGIETTPVASRAAAVSSGVPGFPVLNPSRFQNLVFSDTFVASTRSVNQFRASYLRIRFISNLVVQRDVPRDFGFRYPVNQFFAMPEIGVAALALTGAPRQKDDRKTNNVFAFADTFSYELGAHSLRFGAEIRRSRTDILNGSFSAGNFQFSGIVTGDAFAAYLFGAPRLFLQVDGDKERNFRSTSYSLFFQDSYRLRSNFTVNYGLRWEVFGPFGDSHIFRVGHPRMGTFIAGRQSTYAPDLPRGILVGGFDFGVSRSIVGADLNNVAPRIGFAWDPFKKGKTSIRAGYGIFYDAGILEAIINQTDGTPAVAPAAVAFLPGPGTMADPFRGTSPFRPPITFPIPTTGALSPGLVAPVNTTGYAQQWNLAVQQEFLGKLLFEIGYVGTKGTHLIGSRDPNQPCLASVAQPCNGQTTNTAANLSARRPYRGINNLLLVLPEFNSNYHSLQMSLRQRMDKGLAFQLAYTFSKTIDDNSKPTRDFDIEGQPTRVSLQDNNNRRAERGLAAFDARHRFVANFAYELPIARKATGIVKHLAGNWQVNGILTFQSGSPFTVVDTRDRSFTDSAGRPDVICNPNLPADQRTVQRWFNTACFQAVPLGVRFGTAGRNITFTDGIRQFDFSLLKPFSISERARLEFRAEFFNFFNHPDFASPVNDLASPAFGRVLATSVPERQIQFALKFIF